MEDVHDGSLLKNLAEELGIQESLSDNPDPLIHNPEAGSACLHCILVKKVADLQSDILRMNQEIASTGEVLHVKKEQNSELKGMIDRLKGTCEIEDEDLVPGDKAVSCSCMKKCVIS